MKNDKYKKVDEILLSDGISVHDYISYITTKKLDQLINLPLSSIHELRHKVELINKETRTTKEKGDLLENIACLILATEFSIFDIARNIRTSTNEIDLLITWSAKSKMVNLNNVYNFLGDEFLCECKNYSKKIDVTYIGKFYSLLKTSGMKFGVLFSVFGITGSKWDNGVGLIKKIALKDDIYIIDFNLNDVKKIILNNDNFFSIVENKYLSLKADIDYSNCISHHENEGKFI